MKIPKAINVNITVQLNNLTQKTREYLSAQREIKTNKEKKVYATSTTRTA